MAPLQKAKFLPRALISACVTSTGGKLISSSLAAVFARPLQEILCPLKQSQPMLFLMNERRVVKGPVQLQVANSRPIPGKVRLHAVCHNRLPRFGIIKKSYSLFHSL